MNPDAIRLMLLLLVGFVLGTGATMLAWMITVRRRKRATKSRVRTCPEYPSFKLAFAPRPATWLAVRSQNPQAVRAALGLEHFMPCPWVEGLTGGHGFFIGAPTNGWIIVTGSGLPDPGRDVDECFRFLTGLSRKLGQVQFFQAERVLHHHAWVRVENGVVKRAYAWAAETVWNQGNKTAAEVDLSMKCFGYDEHPAADSWAAAEWMAANVAKVPLLAARWSLDPARIDGRLHKHADGIAGDPL
ncbi:MAG: hypothetical protein ACLQAH_06580 [Limisphaerales bacterium]